MQQKNISAAKNDVALLDEELYKNIIVNVYKVYCGLKLHFNSPYILKNNFNNSGFDEYTMNNRDDIGIFIKVVDYFDRDFDKIKFALISMFLKNKDSWIGDILHQDHKIYNEKRIIKIDNLHYDCQKQIEKLKDYISILDINLNDFLKIENDDRSQFIKKIKPTDEFSAILDYYVSHLKQETNNPLWKNKLFSLEKYKYLLIEDLNEETKNLFLDLVK